MNRLPYTVEETYCQIIYHFCHMITGGEICSSFRTTAVWYYSLYSGCDLVVIIIVRQ